jgi:hypothetical protein
MHPTLRLLSLAALPVLAAPLVACELAEDLAQDATSGLFIERHPCVGNRTDTVHVDDADTFYVGCGSTTSGEGLYRTTDRGSTWESVRDFEAFRVTDIHRGPDGVLYIAGTGPNGQRVNALNDDGPLTPVFEAGTQTWSTFQVGTFVVRPDGSAIAESLTGSDLAYRPSATAPFEDAYPWWTGPDAYQVLDATVHDGRFVGVGSTIIQPPVYFEQDDSAPGFKMDDVVLDTNDGELWAIDSDGTNLIAGGVDQTIDVGVIYWTNSTSDRLDPAGWFAYDLRDDFDDATWIRGVCRDGDRMLAVGEKTALAEGVLIESTDGGATWRNITPTDAPPLSECVIAEGRLVVAGADGWIGVD